MYVYMRIYRTMYKLQTPPSNLATCSPNISISMVNLQITINHPNKSPSMTHAENICWEPWIVLTHMDITTSATPQRLQTSEVEASKHGNSAKEIGRRKARSLVQNISSSVGMIIPNIQYMEKLKNPNHQPAKNS